MRIAYFGTAEFAVPPLRAIAEHVVAVVSQPDRPSGRGMRLTPSPVSALAQELGIDLLRPEKARDPEFIEHMRSLNCDVFVVAAYGQILRESLLEGARHGSVNLHGSILPQYRGAAPIQRAIMDGEAETGVTLMQMAKGMDTGDMIDIVRTPIGPDETYGELAARLSELAAAQLSTWLPRLAAGDYPRVEQDHAAATHAAKIERGESILDPTRPAEEEYRRFRAVTPSPGALLPSQWGDLKVLRARLSHAQVTPATISTEDGFVVGFHGGALRIEELKVPGRSAISGPEFLRGFRIQNGTPLLAT
ncbi:MAG: methionyl-tRNA formyltransferase [Chthonomonas sp.]|nr:methionyl-tRNA formyltransferase [Chthonomonas sp.]